MRVYGAHCNERREGKVTEMVGFTMGINFVRAQLGKCGKIIKQFCYSLLTNVCVLCTIELWSARSDKKRKEKRYENYRQHSVVLVYGSLGRYRVVLHRSYLVHYHHRYPLRTSGIQDRKTHLLAFRQKS